MRAGPAYCRVGAVDRRPRMLRLNRIIFGVVAVFGVVWMIAGFSGLVG